MSLKIRPYSPSDRQAIRSICCDTGFMGNPIDPVYIDREAFADFFTRYYTDFEPENALVFQFRADILSNRLSFQSAIEDYGTAIGLDPDLVSAYLGRGLAYAQMGLYVPAIEDFTKAISINPDNSKSHGFRGDAYLELGQDKKALEDHGEAARLDPGDLRWLTRISRGN